MAKLNHGNRSDRHFFITAARNIGSKIRKGDQVLVDVDAKPAKGRYVVTGPGRIEPWSGQPLVHGVAVRAHRDLLYPT